jgi:hypothetical protein
LPLAHRRDGIAPYHQSTGAGAPVLLVMLELWSSAGHLYPTDMPQADRRTPSFLSA